MATEPINEYRRLEELGGSDYEIVDGEPHIKGWNIKDSLGAKLGKVHELLFNPASRKVRYRSDKRYLVFQCLVHTADAGKVQVRLLALCHERRNLAEYEGYMDEDEALLGQLMESAKTLMSNMEALLAGHRWE